MDAPEIKRQKFNFNNNSYKEENETDTPTSKKVNHKLIDLPYKRGIM